jgi:hypothetical protein
MKELILFNKSEEFIRYLREKFESSSEYFRSNYANYIITIKQNKPKDDNIRIFLTLYEKKLFEKNISYYWVEKISLLSKTWDSFNLHYSKSLYDVTNLQEQLDILEKYDGKQLYLDNPKTFEFLINMMKLKINGRINPYILEEIKKKFRGWFRLLTNLNGIYYSTTWYKFYEIYTELNREQNYTISFYDGHLYTWIKKLKEEKESDKMTIHCDLLLSSVNDNWINDIL